MQRFWYAGLMAIASATSYQASAQADNATEVPPEYADPGPEPQNVIVQIGAGLRGATPDPYSVRDFAICQSHVFPARQGVSFDGGVRKTYWRKAQRTVLFQFRSKNQFGAYDGVRDGIASFENGRLVDVTSYPATTGNSEREKRAIAWRDPCHSIPDAEIQAAISAKRP